MIKFNNFHKIEKYIISGSLPFIFFIKNINDSSVIGLGLALGVILAILMNKFLSFLPRTSRIMIFISAYSGLAVLYSIFLSIYFEIKEPFVFLILANTMAFIVLENEDGKLKLLDIILGTSVSIILLTFFGVLKTLVLSSDGILNSVIPSELSNNTFLHTSIYPVFLAVLLLVLSRITRDGDYD